MYSDKIQLAIEKASIMHNGQVDKAGVPYINHIMCVAFQMNSENEIIVALLHDILEDTSFELSEIKELFGDEICDAVDAITRRDSEDYFNYISRVKKNSLASRVKIADLRHNMSRRNNISESLYNRYKKALEILLGY